MIRKCPCNNTIYKYGENKLILVGSYSLYINTKLNYEYLDTFLFQNEVFYS